MEEEICQTICAPGQWNTWNLKVWRARCPSVIWVLSSFMWWSHCSRASPDQMVNGHLGDNNEESRPPSGLPNTLLQLCSISSPVLAAGQPQDHNYLLGLNSPQPSAQGISRRIKLWTVEQRFHTDSLLNLLKCWMALLCPLGQIWNTLFNKSHETIVCLGA